MWESVALTLAGAAGNNVGKVLQKKGTHILPPLSFKLKVRPPPCYSHHLLPPTYSPHRDAAVRSVDGCLRR